MLDDKWVEIIRKNKREQKMRARIRCTSSDLI